LKAYVDVQILIFAWSTDHTIKKAEWRCLSMEYGELFIIVVTP
jgi:hypothetical protein